MHVKTYLLTMLSPLETAMSRSESHLRQCQTLWDNCDIVDTLAHTLAQKDLQDHH